MKLKKLILFQLALFCGLTIMVACERNEECKLDAANNTEKDAKKIKVSQFSHHSVISTTHSLIK